jgi:hypothetical protein
MPWRYRQLWRTEDKKDWNVYGAAWNWDSFRGLHIFIGKGVFSAGWMQD